MCDVRNENLCGSSGDRQEKRFEPGSAEPTLQWRYEVSYGTCLDVISQCLTILPRYESIRFRAKVLVQFFVRLRDGMQIPDRFNDATLRDRLASNRFIRRDGFASGSFDMISATVSGSSTEAASSFSAPCPDCRS